MLQVTYTAVPQVKHTHAVLIPRPSWMWGAEIGVNDCGVAIGNEAVFTLGKYGEKSLTGMDLLRLALERSESAEEAVKTIIGFLEEYGQGGNCGYDHTFLYDNSFMIMDRVNLFILETHNKEWVWKKTDHASISNRLCIGAEGDKYSADRKCNFKFKNTERVFTAGSGSRSRKGITGNRIAGAETVADFMAALRQHKQGIVNPFSCGSVTSPCMHFGGIVGDHTTSSLIASIEECKTVLWTTGSSTPCVSLFKPWLFGNDLITPYYYGKDTNAVKYWYNQEEFRRKLISKVIPQEYFDLRDALEQKWISQAESASDNSDFELLSAQCYAEEKRFFDYWAKYSFEDASSADSFLKRWETKNAIFAKERISKIME